MPGQAAGPPRGGSSASKRPKSAARKSGGRAAGKRTRPLTAAAERAAEARQAEQFAAAAEVFQAGKYGTARRILEKVEAGPSASLRHRARIYLEICRQKKAARKRVELKSPEDYYHFAVQLVNEGELAKAQRILSRGIALGGDTAHLHYLMAVAKTLAGHPAKAYKPLKAAIELDPAIRILARRDPDLRAAAKQERFAKLLAAPKN